MGCVGEALQRARGRQDLAALKASDHGLGCSHRLSDLLLRHICFTAGFDERSGQCEFCFKGVVGRDKLWVLLPTCEGLVGGDEFTFHWTSLARLSAISISRRGVFWVFF